MFVRNLRKRTTETVRGSSRARSQTRSTTRQTWERPRRLTHRNLSSILTTKNPLPGRASVKSENLSNLRTIAKHGPSAATNRDDAIGADDDADDQREAARKNGTERPKPAQPDTDFAWEDRGDPPDELTPTSDRKPKPLIEPLEPTAGDPFQFDDGEEQPPSVKKQSFARKGKAQAETRRDELTSKSDRKAKPVVIEPLEPAAGDPFQFDDGEEQPPPAKKQSAARKGDAPAETRRERNDVEKRGTTKIFSRPASEFLERGSFIPRFRAGRRFGFYLGRDR